MNVTRHMTSSASVSPLEGEGAYGPAFGAPVDVMCWPEQSSKQVRAAGGEETTSSTRLWCSAAHEPLFPVGSSVTFAGRTSEVIAVSVHDPGALRLPRLLEVALL